jgi:nitrite reductase/ring-hydroxylating ferredoxin subunit
MVVGGKNWHRAMPTADIEDGKPHILEFPEQYVVVVRKGGRIFAFNNACPHLHLPFFEQKADGGVVDGDDRASASQIDEDGTIKCRWHESCFDMNSGQILSWCENLNEDGTSQGMEHVGDISKNRMPLDVIPVREEDGHVWLALD